MRLCDDTYEEIKNEVIHLITHYEVNCMPISSFEFATKMGITLRPYSCLTEDELEVCENLSQDGFAFIHRLDESIYYNDQIQYDRMNMTILHEIGHIALGHKINFESSLFEKEQCEAEANFFAKYAAAPPPLVHRILPKSPEDIMYAFKISFEASFNAYNYYLKWLRNYEKEGEYKDYENKLLCYANAAR